MKITISKSQWKEIGIKTGWIKETNSSTIKLAKNKFSRAWLMNNSRAWLMNNQGTLFQAKVGAQNSITHADFIMKNTKLFKLPSLSFIKKWAFSFNNYLTKAWKNMPSSVVLRYALDTHYKNP